MVVDDNGKLTGLLTETDLFRSATKQRKFSEILKDNVSQEVISLQSDQFIHEALQVFYLKGVKKALVLDEHGRPVGTLSCLDLARVCLLHLQ